MAISHYNLSPKSYGDKLTLFNYNIELVVEGDVIDILVTKKGDERFSATVFTAFVVENFVTKGLDFR